MRNRAGRVSPRIGQPRRQSLTGGMRATTSALPQHAPDDSTYSLHPVCADYHVGPVDASWGRVKATFLLLCFLIVLCVSAADFKTGLDAYNRGDFAAALKEWQPIAEKGDPNAQYNLGLLFARG